jgi:hypothetical protein
MRAVTPPRLSRCAFRFRHFAKPPGRALPKWVNRLDGAFTQMRKPISKRA